MATRTSTQSGNFGTGSTWVGGIAPADGDAIVIAAGHTVHLDADYTGWTTGLAASTITGALDVVQSAGTYGLKLAGTLSGAGKIVFNGGTGVDLPDNIIVNITSTYNGNLVTVTGACDIRCKEPAVPVATLKAAYSAGTSKIYVNETLDSVWANGRYLRVDNINQARQTEEFTIVNTGSDGGGQYITLSAGLAASKLINAKVCLTQRNIHFTGNMGSSQCAMNGVRNSTVNAGFRAFTYALNSCYLNTISGGTYSGNTYALLSCFSTTISGGTYSGNTYVLGYCYMNTISGGTYSGNTQALLSCYSNAISGGTYSGNTYALFSCYSNAISGGTWSGNSYALLSCYSNTISGGTWTSNTYAFRRSSANFTKGVTFTGSTLWYECTPLHQAGWAYGEIINNGGVSGAFSARTAGGTTIHETTIKPADRVRSYKHTGEATTTAAYPCFRQTELTVSPGRTLSVVFDGYKDWANGTNPLMQIIDKYADPLAVPGATALATQSLDNTQNTWFRYTLTYANTGDTAVNVYLRTSMAEPTGNFYAEYTWEYTMTTEERAVLDGIATKAGYLPAATAGSAGGIALVGSEMGLANDAITAAKFDESTAFPVKSADTGATILARLGDKMNLIDAPNATALTAIGTATWATTARTLSEAGVSAIITAMLAITTGAASGAGTLWKRALDFFGAVNYTAPLDTQGTRDALKRAASAGAPVAGSVDAVLAGLDAVKPAHAPEVSETGAVTAGNMVAPPPTDYAKAGDAMTLTTAYDAAMTAASTGELTAAQGAIQQDIAALPALIPPPDMEAAIETLEAAIDAAAQRVLNAGTGVSFTTEPVLDTETGLPVDDVEVRLTSDEAGNTTEARDFTDGTGTITVRLPAGSYFMWLVKSGYSFTGQPYSVEITE
jgi:hypothetical protein